MKIRRATEKDIAAIHAIHVASMRHLQLTNPQKSATEQAGVNAFINERRPEHVAEEMTQQRFIVAQDEGRILGFTALLIPKTEITMVFVDPASQRSGIGRAMLAGIEAIAREEGLEELQLRATGTAIEFYLRTGYQSEPPVEPGAEWALMKKRIA